MMKLICDKCGKSFERENNVYGTYCPYCDNTIKPINKPKFVEDLEIIKKSLQAEMLEMFRINFKEKK